MRAFGDDGHVIAHVAELDPLAEETLELSAAVDPCGVEGVAAALEVVVEHDDGVSEIGLVVAAHDDA